MPGVAIVAEGKVRFNYVGGKWCRDGSRPQSRHDPLADIEILQDRGALRMIMKDGALHKAA